MTRLDATRHSPDGLRSHPYIVLFALWLQVFTVCCMVNIVVPLLSDIGDALDIPTRLRGTVVTAYALAVGGSALLAGPLSDRIGRRPVMLFGTTAAATMLLLHAFATNYIELLSVRALAGLAGGLLSGSAVAYVGDYFAPHRRGWATGHALSGVAFGNMVGIPAGAAMVGIVGFRGVFVALGVLMAVVALVVKRALPELQPIRNTHSGDGLLADALRKYVALARAPNVRRLLMVNVVGLIAMHSFFVYAPTWMTTELGMGASGLSLAFLIGGVASFFGSSLAGRAADRGHAPLVIGSACAVFAALAFVSVQDFMSPLTIVPVFGVLMLAMTAHVTSIFSLATTAVGRQRRGTLMSATHSSGQIGMGIGAAIAGTVYDAYGVTANAAVAAALLVPLVIVVRTFPVVATEVAS